MGFRVVFRDFQRKILACASTYVDGRWELAVCEAMTMDFGLQLALELCFF